MHTVIIINERSAELLKDYKLLFEPYVDNGCISFCSWNESGTDIKSSIPDLYKIVKGKYEWRAIVIAGSTQDYCANAEDVSPENPFDFNCHNTVDTHVTESSIPLIRLTHMIAGFPSLGIKDFAKAYAYYDEKTGKEKIVKEDQVFFGTGSDSDGENIHNGDIQSIRCLEEIDNECGETVLIKDDDAFLSVTARELQITYVEETYSEQEQRQHKELQQKYSFLEDRPKEILLIATKQKTEENTKMEVMKFWKNSLETESSNFWTRNNYPTNCRFLNYQLTDIENSSYTKELAELWMAVLTIAINAIPPSSLQAYRLYRFAVDISNEDFGSALNNHMSKMLSAGSSVSQRLAKRPEYSFGQEEDFLTPQQVPVIFNLTDGNDLYVREMPLGLSSNCPVNEMDFWQNTIREKRRKFEKFIKTPERAIDVASEYARGRADSFIGSEYELDKYQLKDLEEQIDALEWEVITTDTRNVFNKREFIKRMEDADTAVRKFMRSRMRKKTVLIAGFTAVFAYFMGFIPFIINATITNFSAFPISISVAIAGVAFVAAGGLIALILHMLKLKKLIKRFDNVMREIVSVINNGAKKFEVYLTNVCTYMRGQSIKNGVTLKSENAGSVFRMLRLHQVMLKQSIRHEEELCAAFGVKLEIEPILNSSTFFNPEISPKENSLYRLSTNNDVDDIPINDTGDKITAPYKFIKKLYVEREELYETPKGEV